jgi:hypothetical protein
MLISKLRLCTFSCIVVLSLLILLVNHDFVFLYRKALIIFSGDMEGLHERVANIGHEVNHATSKTKEWNKWSCKLYLEGKVQLKHFYKKQAI